jgi:hypothetical protein
MVDYVIWWLDQPSCELAIWLGAKHADWPTYIKKEFDSRVGRAGRGRLWVPPDIQFSVQWKDGDPAFDAIGDDCGGIVIRLDDAHRVLSWPGLVTDENLRPIVVTPLRAGERLR